MMKKTFLIALSILTLTSSLNAFASTLDDNVIEDLEKFHIVEKSDDLRLNDHITRAEVVKMVSVATGNYDIDHVGTDQIFSDVPPTHWVVKYVRTAWDSYIISGYEDNTFRPENNITYNELQKIIVSALGYTQYAEMQGGYPDGYLTYSEKYNIMNNVDTSDSNAYVTRKDAMQMIYNSLDAPLLVYMQTNYLKDGSITYVYEWRDGEHRQFESLRMRLDEEFS